MTTEEAVHRLIELVADPSTYDAYEDNELETRYTSDDALAELVAMRVVALPILLAALPATPVETARLLLHVFARFRPRELAALPDAELERMIGWVEKLADPPGPYPHERLRVIQYRDERVKLRVALPWERAFATRLRAGELADQELFFTARLAHPSVDERALAIRRLVHLARDQARFSEYLASLLADDSSTIRNRAAQALADLPPRLRPDTVRRLAAALPESPRLVALPLVGALARHGAPATGIAPFCLEVLRRPGRGNYELQRAAIQAAFLLGEIAPPIRGELVTTLASLNTFGPSGPHMLRVLGAVGDPAALASAMLDLRRTLTGDDIAAIADVCEALLFLPATPEPLVGPLLDQLGRDRPYKLVNSLLGVLGYSGDGRAVPPLVAHTDGHSRYAAIQALTALGPLARAAVPKLEALRVQLRDAGRSLHVDVERALEAIAPDLS